MVLLCLIFNIPLLIMIMIIVSIMIINLCLIVSVILKFQLLLFLALIIYQIYTIEFFPFSLIDHTEISISHNTHDNTRNVRISQFINS